MRLKTRYRTEEKHLADIGPAPSEKIDINDEPAPNAVAPDPATLRLNEQLAALQHSEAVQRLMAFAANQAAAQGHQPGSPDHQRATRQIFDRHLQAAANGAPTQSSPPEPAVTESPEFFRPPAPPEPPSPASYVSAPVSRGEVGSYHREPSLSSVRLSPQEKEIARASGISETQYAANKLKMLREQASGERRR
jgi:hypothetical protein